MSDAEIINRLLDRIVIVDERGIDGCHVLVNGARSPTGWGGDVGAKQEAAFVRAIIVAAVRLVEERQHAGEGAISAYLRHVAECPITPPCSWGRSGPCSSCVAGEVLAGAIKSPVTPPVPPQPETPLVDRLADALEYAREQDRRGLHSSDETLARWDALLVEHAASVKAPQPETRPMLTEWRPGRAGSTFACYVVGADEEASDAAVETFAGGHWSVFAAGTSLAVAHGKAEDAEAAKVPALEAARRWYTLPADPAPLQPACRACGKPLDRIADNLADGCPCNAPRGINHGLVARHVCTCIECDPEQTGAPRPHGEATCWTNAPPLWCLECHCPVDWHDRSGCGGELGATPPRRHGLSPRDQARCRCASRYDLATGARLAFPRPPRDEEEREAVEANVDGSPWCNAKDPAGPTPAFTLRCTRRPHVTGDCIAAVGRSVGARWRRPAPPQPHATGTPLAAAVRALAAYYDRIASAETNPAKATAYLQVAADMWTTVDGAGESTPQPHDGERATIPRIPASAFEQLERDARAYGTGYLRRHRDSTFERIPATEMITLDAPPSETRSEPETHAPERVDVAEAVTVLRSLDNATDPTDPELAAGTRRAVATVQTLAAEADHLRADLAHAQLAAAEAVRVLGLIVDHRFDPKAVMEFASDAIGYLRSPTPNVSAPAPAAPETRAQAIEACALEANVTLEAARQLLRGTIFAADHPRYALVIAEARHHPILTDSPALTRAVEEPAPALTGGTGTGEVKS